MTKILFILTLVAFIALPFQVYALESSQSAEISFNRESINPDSIFYPFKRGWEKIWGYVVSFHLNTKQKFEKDLTITRFNELSYIAENKKYHQFKEASSRYVTLLQEMMNNKDKLTEVEKQKLTDQINSLKNLQKKYENDYAYWSFLQQAIETSQKYLSS